MSDRMLILTITRIEADHLADLVTQFSELLDETRTDADSAIDPAVARLVPDVYPDDAEASSEFRRATQSDLLGRRGQDAERVLSDLRGTVDSHTKDDAARPVDIALDEDGVRAWMRTLTAIRLVIASRLGIEDEDDRDEDDPRFGVYDWLGYRLEGLIQASEP
ncbi:MAG TPA: DUF2017 family protein [Microbacterium sp.]|uniref:DUF2017 family protein n=1 Tax=Microbacterium sp. TaxID=51671 RepID=UPI002C197391|nr:DUF2017 family protein [Microbacterium sp.]HWI30366.1 DUF2017 family protein [Microbacterium sp.]